MHSTCRCSWTERMLQTPIIADQMYILLLTLTLLAGLTLARRLAEPACPACSSKSWHDHPTHLQCARCGWTNVALAPAIRAEPVTVAPQYDIPLSLDAIGSSRDA